MHQKLTERVVDLNPRETSEWVEALEQVLDQEGPDRAAFLLERLTEQARGAGADLRGSAWLARPPTASSPLVHSKKPLRVRIPFICTGVSIHPYLRSGSPQAFKPRSFARWGGAGRFAWRIFGGRRGCQRVKVSNRMRKTLANPGWRQRVRSSSSA